MLATNVSQNAYLRQTRVNHRRMYDSNEKRKTSLIVAPQIRNVVSSGKFMTTTHDYQRIPFTLNSGASIVREFKKITEQSSSLCVEWTQELPQWHQDKDGNPILETIFTGERYNNTDIFRVSSFSGTITKDFDVQNIVTQCFAVVIQSSTNVLGVYSPVQGFYPTHLAQVQQNLCISALSQRQNGPLDEIRRLIMYVKNEVHGKPIPTAPQWTPTENLGWTQSSSASCPGRIDADQISLDGDVPAVERPRRSTIEARGQIPTRQVTSHPIQTYPPVPVTASPTPPPAPQPFTQAPPPQNVQMAPRNAPNVESDPMHNVLLICLLIAFLAFGYCVWNAPQRYIPTTYNNIPNHGWHGHPEAHKTDATKIQAEDEPKAHETSQESSRCKEQERGTPTLIVQPKTTKKISLSINNDIPFSPYFRERIVNAIKLTDGYYGCDAEFSEDEPSNVIITCDPEVTQLYESKQVY